MIGENYVSVPTHFFKVVVGEMENSSLELEAYVLPNQVTSNFMLTISPSPYNRGGSFKEIVLSRVS